MPTPVPACSRGLLLCIFLLGATITLGSASSIDCDWGSGGGSNFTGWVRHGARCYRWTEAQDYWLPAEQTCNAGPVGGHLVSINSELENTLVGRLTYCQPAWIGLYGIDADRLAQPGQYRWTDGSLSGVSKHNFSRLTTPHQPLVTAEGLQWHNNYYHAKSGYVCEAPAPNNRTGEATGCPSGWRRLGDFCYLQPGFPATYIEASFYCDGRHAHLASVHNERELRLLSLFDLDQPSCSLELWAGLVKLNPCRMDFSSGQQVCFRWADRSGDHRGFPAWAAGHPNGDLVTNCVVLKDRSLRSEPCHLRRSFICKRPAGMGTPEPPTQQPPTWRPPTQDPQTWRPPTQDPQTWRPPTQDPQTWRPPTQDPQTWRPPTQDPQTWRPPTPDPETWPTPQPLSSVQAAYDFRRTPVQNLAQPGRYRILSFGDAKLGDPQGAVLNGQRGIQVDTESATLTRPLKQTGNWTLFYYAKRATDYDELLVDISKGGSTEPSLTLLEHPDTTDLVLYGRTGYFRDESDQVKASKDRHPWLRGAVVFSAGRAHFYRNLEDVSAHKPATTNTQYADSDAYLVLGSAYQSSLPGYRGVIACFGVAHAALSREELVGAFQRYCP